MGRYIFNLPDIGEGIAEAEIVAWHVKVGDTIAEDAPLADMLTDKATVEMESPISGVVAKIAGEVGDVVAIGAMLVEIETDEVSEGDHDAHNGGAEAVGDDALPLPKEETDADADAEPEPEPEGEAKHDAHHASPGEEGQVHPETKVLASPAVRKRAQDLGVALSDVRPAADGRIRHSDLDNFLAYNRMYGASQNARNDEHIKVIGMRRRIAENMAASKRHIPHFSYVEECDVTEFEKMRGDLNAHRGDRDKLTLLPLMIRAICKTVIKFPMINARYDDEAGVVTRHGAVHMGMAAQTDNGLIVPVIRNAHSLNIWQLAREIQRLAVNARSGTITPQDLGGGTLTITSLGALGGIATTPVINRPEVAIIGPNRIIERPAFVRDSMGAERIEKRKLMNISISCDHRVVDGYDAASFVQALKNMIETPALIIADEL